MNRPLYTVQHVAERLGVTKDCMLTTAGEWLASERARAKLHAVMTVTEVCDASRMSSSFVRREITQGNLKAARFGKGERGELHMKREDYDAWFEANLVVPVRPGAW